MRCLRSPTAGVALRPLRAYLPSSTTQFRGSGIAFCIEPIRLGNCSTTLFIGLRKIIQRGGDRGAALCQTGAHGFKIF
jgi:hypothetical protein